MFILHFACIHNETLTGVSVVVPQHINYQGKFAETALININNKNINCVKKQLMYKHPFSILEIESNYKKPDLVIFHECYRAEYLFIAHELKKNNIPYILIPHGELRIEAQHKKRLKKTVANFLLFNRFIKKSLSIQCLSEEELIKTRFKVKKFIGTNGTSIPIIKKNCFNNEKTNFVYIGRLESYVKGLDLFVKAVSLNASYFRDNHCTFSIYGPDIEGRGIFFDKMVKKLKVEDLIRRFPPVFGKQKEEILVNADVFFQTSRHEGMPTGILEALSYGLPCAITKGTTLGEIVHKENAGWTSENDSQSISNMLVNVVKQSVDLMEKGNNARELIKKYYSWDDVAKETVEKYKELLND